MMHFKRKGDMMRGHYHNYDHITLLSKGSVRITKDTGEQEILTAPAMYLTKHDVRHEIEALEDDCVASCVHAIRDDDGTVIDPTPELSEHTITDHNPTQEEDNAAAELVDRLNRGRIDPFVRANAKVITDEDSTDK
jgi:hypothetical protein